MFVRATGAANFARYIIGASRNTAGRLRRCCARADRYDLATLLLFGALVLLVAITFGDYAISNDEGVQQRYGEMIVAYYASGFTDQALFHFRNLFLYGGLFDVIAVGFEKLVPLDIYAVRHLLSALIGLSGIAAVWATARTIGGSRAGLLAAAALAVCGTWYGAMFNHTKDIPFAAAMIGALCLLVLIARELPRPRWRLVLLFGVLCGCALGIRVLGLFLLSYALLAVALHVPVSRRASWRDVLLFAARSAVPFAAAFAVAYVIMIVAWPWAALAPLNPLRGLMTFVDFNYPIQTMLAGRVYHMGEVPRWYVPVYMVIKLTLWLLIGAGLAIVFAALPQRAGGVADNRTRKEIALVAFAALFPLICEVVVAGPAFSGMRHFLFTVPPIAVLAGLGIDGMLRRLETRDWRLAGVAAAIVLVGLGSNATTLYRLHPDEYLFFSPVVGGLTGATRQYDTDYWANSMPEALADLERYLDRTEGPWGKATPRHRYTVAICSEPLQFERQADDARLAWTHDSRHADFFIAPTNMNCDRAVGGKIVATVTRLGVVIGVVKDRRAEISRSAARVQ
jgi:hypothetical protein